MRTKILRYYTPEAHKMYSEMTLKSDLRVEVLPIEYYQELVRRMPGQAELIALVKDDRLIGIGWCLYDATYHMMYAGVDYTISRDYDLYFNLMFMGFDRALSRGVSASTSARRRRRSSHEWAAIRKNATSTRRASASS